MPYSLPKLDYSESGSVRYSNDASILARDVNNYNAWPGTDLDIFRGDYFYPQFQFSSSGGKIFIGCNKLTWPMEFEHEEYKDNVSLNPFNDGFYDTDNPFMAAFDRYTGRLVSCFGQPDKSARASRTGYYFVSQVSVVEGDELAYSDGYSGTVYIADTADVAHAKASYKAIETDLGSMPAIDSTKFYTYEYVKPYKAKVYYRIVKGIRLNEDKVFCLVKYNNDDTTGKSAQNYSFVEIDRKSGRSRELAYPEHADCNVFSRSLCTKGGKIRPFEVLKKDGKAWLRIYHI